MKGLNKNKEIIKWKWNAHKYWATLISKNKFTEKERVLIVIKRKIFMISNRTLNKIKINSITLLKKIKINITKVDYIKLVL